MTENVEAKLKDFLKYSMEHSKYYEYALSYNGDIEDFRVLKKEDVKRNATELHSTGINGKSPNNMVRTYTSGTDGIPLNICWLKSDYIRANIELWRKRYKYYNITATSRKLSFNLGGKDMISYSNYGLDINKTAIYDPSLFLDIHKTIMNFAPDWIYVKPHIFKFYMQQINMNGFCFPNSVKYIEFVGENISASEEERIRNELGVSVGNLYGSEEMNAIALECPWHKMHIIENNVFVEVQDGNGGIKKQGRGAAILTNMQNHYMPFIRYYQGDQISIYKIQCPCKCGENGRVIAKIHGRVTELFSRNGKIISSSILSEIMNDIDYVLNYPINRYMFIYKKSKGKLTLTLELKDSFTNWKHAVSEQIVETIRDRLEIDVDLTFCELPMDNERQKRQILLVED